MSASTLDPKVYAVLNAWITKIPLTYGKNYYVLDHSTAEDTELIVIENRFTWRFGTSPKLTAIFKANHFEYLKQKVFSTTPPQEGVSTIDVDCNRLIEFLNHFDNDFASNQEKIGGFIGKNFI